MRPKLVVIVLFVALVPLAVSAFTALRVHRAAFDREVAARQRDAARYGAALASAALDDARRTFAAAARPIPWGELSADELAGAVSLVYQQRDDVVVAQLLDEAGDGVGPAAYVDARAAAGGAHAAHPAATGALLERVAAAIPVGAHQRDEVAVGAPFAGPHGRTYVALAVPVAGPAGRPWTLAVAIDLAPLCAALQGAPSDGLQMVLADRDGRAVCHAPGAPPLAPVADVVRRAAGGQLVSFDGPTGERLVAAVAPAALGWSVIAQQPAARVSAPARTMRARTWYWLAVSAVVAVVAGLVLAQGIVGPVRALRAGAGALASGDLSHRIAVTGRDELAELARAFNDMAAQIQARDDEIRRWNRELQQRVDERTRELREAQRQLLQSQKIAAVSSLAAGIAHEINNPLTGVLGLTQVLRAQAPEAQRPTFDMIEREARRIRDIVQTLQGFSQEFAGEGMAAVDVRGVVDAAVEMVAARVDRGEIELVCDHAADLPPIRGNAGQLRQAVLHVLTNAIAATPPGGRVTASTRSVEGGAVRVAVSDTGAGIAPEILDRIFEPFFTTKQEWEGRGLGLTVVYRIVEEHGGSIHVDSEVGRGTTVAIVLPAARGGAHLV